MSEQAKKQPPRVNAGKINPYFSLISNSSILTGFCGPVELQAQYNTFKATLQQLSQKIGELESEADEHKLVLETLNGVKDPETRKCFRMVGGVLVQRTVKEVVPVLETNMTGLQTVLSTLAKDYKKTEDEMTKWQKKNNVQIVQT